MLTSPKLTVLDGYTRGIAVCSLMLLSLASCIPVIPTTSTLDVGDGGFLSEEPCGPPCFWGIIPGQTTEAEVTEILQERGVLEACYMIDHEDEGGFRGMDCGSQVFIDFERGGNLVTGVGFKPTTTITVQDVVEKYEEPQGIAVHALGVHVIDLQLVMAYPSMLTRVIFPTQRVSLPLQEPYILEPSTPVDSIAYSIDGGEIPLVEDSYWEEWHGYGEYYHPQQRR